MSRCLSRVLRRTRRWRYCCGCDRPIFVGAPYAHYAYTIDGEFHYCDLCARCDEEQQRVYAEAEGGGER